MAGPLDFEALETALASASHRWVARRLEQILNADRSDGDLAVRSCPCGGQQQFKGRFARQFVTAVGPLTLERAYYYCYDCNSGTHPRDEALGLDDRSVSPGVQRMIGLVSARNSFAESQYLLRELAKVKVSTSQVQRTAEILGQRIARHEQNQTELESPPAPTLYLGMDGTGVPMRTAETAGRPGKQPDGRSKTREMKIVSVWSAEGRNEKGHAVVDPDSVTHSAAIESAHAPDSAKLLSAFARRVEREALRRGFDQAPRQVVIGDGARWIWNLCTELFPKAIQIVDIYHAKEKLWELGKLLYGNGSDLARRWSEDRIQQLKDGELEKLVQVLESESSRHESVDLVIGYYQHNKERMRYATFRDQGLCISSAVVEAGCKNAIGTRLKRGGMHWTVKGANEIAALRCYVKSNRHDDFWYQKMLNP